MSKIYHEVEQCQYESELHDKMKSCEKHRGHTRFYHVSDMYLPNLIPPRYHGTLWLDYTNTIIQLTVKLMVSYASKDRPDGFPGANIDDKCRHRPNIGTGRVTRVVRQYTGIDGETCPCRDCRKHPEKARIQWAKFEVLTSLHVVYNDEECQQTKCDVSYDRDENLTKCPKLEGVKVFKGDKDRDLCMMSCVTHDESACYRLEENLTRFYEIRRQLADICKRSAFCGDMSKVIVVCVSHPHGMSKHVTVGEWTGRKDKDPPHRWTHTAETCGGSSGAPVFMLGGYGLSCTNPSTHSGVDENGDGTCGWEGWHF